MLSEAELADLSCPCCGKTIISWPLQNLLRQLRTQLGELPRITRGYVCEQYRTGAPWTLDRAHSEGRSVTFALIDQYHRHAALSAMLKVFDRVWIHGTRVTCFVDDTAQSPWCVIV